MVFFLVIDGLFNEKGSVEVAWGLQKSLESGDAGKDDMQCSKHNNKTHHKYGPTLNSFLWLKTRKRMQV